MLSIPAAFRLSILTRAAVFALALVAAVSSPPARAEQASDREPDPTSASMEPLLAGEFALQSGRLDDAARWYLEAAKAANDVALAERATRIALLAKDDARAADAIALWRRLGGDSVGLQGAEATLALRRGADRQARRHLAAMMKRPGDEGWRQAFTVLLTGARDPQQSAKLLERLVDDGDIPAKLPAWLAFGGLAQKLEQPKLAERIVDEVVKRFPGEPRVALLRASQLREAGKTDEARQVLVQLDEQAATDAELRLAIAGEYDSMGDQKAAAAVLAHGPQDDQTYSLRASLLARAEDKPTLTALYDELRRNASKPEPGRRLLLGQLAEFLERYEEALDWYRGVPGGPQRWQARLRATSVLHELKRDKEAYAELEAIQSDVVADDETRRDAYLLEAALRQKDMNEAGEFDAYARGLAAFPDDPDLLYARALGWERRDDIARAEADFRRILVADPDSVAALNALGYTLADRTTRYREALELIDRARAAEPDNAAIIDSYGWVLFRLGRKTEALVELRHAFALQKDAEIAAHIAEVLWELGKRDEARKYFDEAAKLDPDNRSLKRALERTGASASAGVGA